ncbi:hypothetical protein UCDDA912_g01345 [Diaporthe ampelina]|uniref:TM7S3/TM198-like domain-containing protein n=1 Tax=Diaporthe ampelina TaxID=1214573 RepID=A0A0G2FWS9_9PEZI|nr:hypothetical protein UCDDA912_g01345 [Diaporthe ampelina]
MNPPISDGVQGAYVVAATGTGLLLGGGALVFKEVTECLACLLGGFCLAMWLLTLKEGGLLGSGGAGVTIFIAVFSAAGGATAVVIGIDCFSRAGLKEYWAWIWDINDNLFPFGADTYPLTRGIRVEQAITIIISMIGLVSQNKLWLIVKEHRARKEEERIRAEAENQEHEANVGRDVERANASERKQWEAVYGGKGPMGVHMSEDSGVGDIYNERKPRNSGTTTTATATRRSTIDEREEIEMAEIPIAQEERASDAVTELPGGHQPDPPKPKTAAEKVLDRNADGMVTVRVAVDDVTAGSPAAGKEEEEKAWLIGDDGEEDNESIAANLDESDGYSVRAVTPTDERPFGMEIKAELAGEEIQEKVTAKRPTSEVTVSTDILNPPATDANTTRSPDATKFKPSLDSMLTSEKTGAKQVEEASPVEDESVSKAGKSLASEADSGRLSLTKDRLPRGLSKIALSYRTNEWAKHLSNAEMPSPAELRIPHEPEPEMAEVKEVEEKAAPVNVDELKKTALDATPPPAMPSPQTLIGQRDLLMRKKASVLRPDSVQQGKISPPSSAAVSDSGSVRGVAPAPSYGTVAALPPPAIMWGPNAAGSAPNSRRSSGTAGISGSALVDADDLPLSQRRAMIRQDSMTSVNSGSLVGGANFNSHQPQRTSTLPSQAARESQLASFRQSVQQELRNTPSGMPAVNANAQLGYGGGYGGGGGGSSSSSSTQPQGRLIDSIYGVPGTSSANSLPQHVLRQSYDAEVQRDIETQRSFMMGQRQAEAQKRQTLKTGRERAGRMFEQRIRSDRDMMEMHREALRKMQRRASQADQRMQ